MDAAVSSGSEFAAAIARSVLTVVEFTGPDCVICKRLEVMLRAAVLQSAVDVSMLQIDASRLVDVAERYSILSVPTLIAFRSNSIVGRKLGFATAAELRNWFELTDRFPEKLQ